MNPSGLLKLVKRKQQEAVAEETAKKPKATI